MPSTLLKRKDRVKEDKLLAQSQTAGKRWCSDLIWERILVSSLLSFLLVFFPFTLLSFPLPPLLKQGLL